MGSINLGLAIVAVVLAIAGLGCLWWRQKTSRDVALMASLQASKAADVLRAQPGTFVEMKGIVRCAEPLKADFSQRACVYFRSEITRQDVYYDTDSQGKQRRNTRTTTVHSNTAQAACRVEDDTGAVNVKLEGAEIEADSVVDGHGIPGSFPNVISTITNIVSDTTFRHWERILAVDIPVYLIGEVQADGSIAKPAKGSSNRTFVISYKSEEERAKDVASNVTFALWLAVLSFVAAIAVFAWAIVRGPA